MVLRDYLRFLKHPHYSFLRFCLANISKKRIIKGPFSGMLFNVPNFNTAMLIGTWELELEEHISKIFNNKPCNIFCIGAAEGYYAVGFARNLPASKVYAFEMQETYRNFLLNLSASNNCKNIEIHGECTNEYLHQFLSNDDRSSLVFCDIEGGEIDLLDFNKIPELKKTSILVEIHEMYVANCERTLIDRFKNTHSYTIIQGRVRTLQDLPKELNFLRFISTPQKTISLMGEGRPYPMNWLYFEPK
jgi:hypothetical protein